MPKPVKKETKRVVKRGPKSKPSVTGPGIIGMDSKDLLNAYEFEVGIGPLITMSFSKITDLGRSGSLGVIGDGGNNDTMHFYLKPRREPDTIRFERGWMTGVKSKVMSYLFEGVIVNNVMIMVKRNGKTEKTLSIERGVLTRISYSDLDASQSKILIKTLEIQHTGLKES